MFEAAKAGCLNCVTRCLTERQISPYDTSLTEKYTILDYARFGSAQGSTTTENLVAYLENMTPPIPEHTEPALMDVPTMRAEKMHRTGSSPTFVATLAVPRVLDVPSCERRVSRLCKQVCGGKTPRPPLPIGHYALHRVGLRIVWNCKRICRNRRRSAVLG